MFSQNDALKHFKDREKAIQAFDGLYDAPSRVWVLALEGFSGHGKSTLIEWLIENRCERDHVPYSLLDFQELFNPKQILDGWLEQASLLDHVPAAAYETYRARRDAALSERDKRVLSIQFNQMQTDGSSNMQTITADVAKALREIDRQTDERLTDAWLDGLREAQLPRLVLFLDSFERFQDRVDAELLGWLWKTLERVRAHLPRLLVVVGSRERVRAPERNMLPTPIELFDAATSDLCMQSLGVEDADFRRAVYERLAKGHPLTTRFAAEAWLAASEVGMPIKASEVPNMELDDAVEWVQGRIIDRLDEPLKSAVRWTALLRFFNLESLNAVLEQPLNAAQFRQLIGYSFVETTGDVNRKGWVCHPLVRRVQKSYLKREQPDGFTAFHLRAFDYWQSRDLLETLYHQFYIDPEQAFSNWRDTVHWATRQNKRDVLDPAYSLADAVLNDLPPFQRAEMHINYGFNFMSSGKPESALAHLNEGLALAKQVKSDVLQAQGNHYLGIHSLTHADYTEGGRYYEEARRLYHSMGLVVNEAECMRALGDIYLQLDDLPAAKAIIEESLPIFRASGNVGALANAVHSLGKVLMQMDEYEQARVQFQEALALTQQDDTPLGDDMPMLSLGRLHLRLQEYDQAKALIEQALKLARESETTLSIAEALYVMGDLYSAQNSAAEAERYFEEALLMYKDHDQLGEAKTLIRLAALDETNQNPQRAITRLERALPIYQRMNDSQWVAIIYGSLGSLCYTIGDLQNAVAYSKEALTLFDALGDAQQLSMIRSFLAEISYTTGDFLLALEYIDPVIEQFASQPEFIAPWLNLLVFSIQVFAQLGRRDDLIKRIEQGEVRLSDVPDEAVNWYFGIAGAYAILKDYPAALNCLEKAAQLSPEDSDVFATIALYASRALRLDDAQKALDQVFKLNPDALWNIVLQGEILTLRGEAQKALECADNVLAKSPEEVDGFSLKARALLVMANLAEAKEMAQRAASLLTTKQEVSACLEDLDVLQNAHPTLQGVESLREIYQSAGERFQ